MCGVAVSRRQLQADPCADIDGSGLVGVEDLLLLLASYSTDAGGDTNGDGLLDLVSVSGVGKMLYYENIGSYDAPKYKEMIGNSNPFIGINLWSGSTPSSIALADLRGDIY